MLENNVCLAEILASPLDDALKHLQERQIPYKICIIKPVSSKFQLSEQLYCINAVRLLNGDVEITAAYRQIGFMDSDWKEV